jgi:hypothetical protein
MIVIVKTRHWPCHGRSHRHLPHLCERARVAPTMEGRITRPMVTCFFACLLAFLVCWLFLVCCLVFARRGPYASRTNDSANNGVARKGWGSMCRDGREARTSSSRNVLCHGNRIHRFSVTHTHHRCQRRSPLSPPSAAAAVGATLLTIIRRPLLRFFGLEATWGSSFVIILRK